MSLKSLTLAAAAVISFSTPVFADSKIMIEDAYARVASKAAKAGAAFLIINNMGDSDDRLIGVSSDVSVRTELHTHKDMGDGVMKMMHVEEGFAIPAGGAHALERGGDHLMFMGLNGPLAHGDVVNVVLTFENAGEMKLEIPVDLERKAAHGDGHHGGHKDDGHKGHGDMEHGKKDDHAHH